MLDSDTFQFEVQAEYEGVNVGDRYVAVGFNGEEGEMYPATAIVSAQAASPVSQLYWNFEKGQPEKIASSSNEIDAEIVIEGEGYLYIK